MHLLDVCNKIDPRRNSFERVPDHRRYWEWMVVHLDRLYSRRGCVELLLQIPHHRIPERFHIGSKTAQCIQETLQLLSQLLAVAPRIDNTMVLIGLHSMLHVMQSELTYVDCKLYK